MTLLHSRPNNHSDKWVSSFLRTLTSLRVTDELKRHVCYLRNGAYGSESFSSKAVRLETLQIFVAGDFRCVMFYRHHRSVSSFDSRAVVSHLDTIQTIIVLGLKHSLITAWPAAVYLRTPVSTTWRKSKTIYKVIIMRTFLEIAI